MTASTLFDVGLGDRPRRELVPGAVHVPSWLTTRQQQWIAGRFFEWARGPVPLRAAKVRGHEMSVQTVCLGWHWQPYLPFVFGGPARFAFHGVTKVHPGTAPAGCGLPEGRINVTMRVTGLQ